MTQGVARFPRYIAEIVDQDVIPNAGLGAEGFQFMHDNARPRQKYASGSTRTTMGCILWCKVPTYTSSSISGRAERRIRRWEWNVYSWDTISIESTSRCEVLYRSYNWRELAPMRELDGGSRAPEEPREMLNFIKAIDECPWIQSYLGLFLVGEAYNSRIWWQCS